MLCFHIWENRYSLEEVFRFNFWLHLANFEPTGLKMLKTLKKKNSEADSFTEGMAQPKEREIKIHFNSRRNLLAFKIFFMEFVKSDCILLTSPQNQYFAAMLQHLTRLSKTFLVLPYLVCLQIFSF